jgi:hypothetical protein
VVDGLLGDRTQSAGLFTSGQQALIAVLTARR